jgi:hypothetical protein
MRIVWHGLPRPGLVLLLAIVVAGAMARRASVSAASDGEWGSPSPVRHTATVPWLTVCGLDPFERGKELSFSLGEAQEVYVSVWSAAGSLVRDWPAAVYPRGDFAFYWDGARNDGREVPAGVYVVRYDFGGVWSARRLLVIGGMP